jgi:fumarate reductase iron-sulfur subunit
VAENIKTARILKFDIFRYNPAEPDKPPYMQRFEIEEAPYMSLFLALNQIREEQDSSLQFDFVCRSAVCGSCGMMVNGRPALGCQTLTADLPEVISLHPVPTFALIGDLSVDTGRWFRSMVDRVNGWIERETEFDRASIEAPMDNATADKIYEADRCIECGCCVAGCAVANVRPDFLGATGLNRIARFMMDPRDQRSEQSWFEVVSDSEGVFGCIGMMACDDVCPKDLPLLEVYSYVRRKAVASLFSSGEDHPARREAQKA